MALELQEILDGKVLKLDNFEELKKDFSEKIKKYQNLVVTEDAIGLAKKDRANLNKRIDTIKSLRTRAKKEIVGTFENQCKELIEILELGVNNIDKQVKEYEQKEKDLKKENVEKLFSELELHKAITLEKVWNEKWVNKGYSLEEIKKELIGIHNKFSDDIEILASICGNEVEFEIGSQELERTLDLKKARDQVMNYREIERIKKEKQSKVTSHYEEKTFEIGFIVQVSYNQATALNDFLAINGIKFVQLTKEQIKEIKGEE